MAEKAFSVLYDGPAIESGRIPVRDLAPALLALGDLFIDASLLSRPRQRPVALSIQATGQGSFVVHLVLEAENAWDHVEELFTSPGVTTLDNLFTLILGGTGVLALIRKVKHRKIVSQEAISAGYIRLTLEDGETIEIPAEVLAFYRRQNIREKARDVVAPLQNPGIKRIEFRADTAPEVTIESTDVSSFDIPEINVPLGDHEVETVAAIASVAFTEGNKWRLSDGDHTFYAAIEDVSFLKRVNEGVESFRKGDMLRCKMRVVQSQRAEGLHTEYQVIEVLEHRPREIQLQLPQHQPIDLPSSGRELERGSDEDTGELGEHR